MGKITVELNHDHGTTKHLIPKGTKFQVDEHIFNQCKQFNRYIEVTYNNLIRKISPAKLDKVTTPLDFATQEEYVILECIEPLYNVELGSLHKVKKSSWENTSSTLTLSENVKEQGSFRKDRFKIHQPNQILNPVTGKPRNPKTIEVKVISDSIAKTDDDRTHYKIVKDSIIEVNKEEWDNRALQKVTIKTDRPEYELKEWKYNLRFISTMKNLLEPIKPDECFEDKQITIKCINSKGYLQRLTLGKTYQIYQSEWDKHQEYILSKFDSKEGVYQMSKSRFIIVSDEMKAKEPFYNKMQIKAITDIQLQPNLAIKKDSIYTVDLQDWDNDKLYIKLNIGKDYYHCDKYNFRSIRTVHEEAGIFPSIPIDKPLHPDTIKVQCINHHVGQYDKGNPFTFELYSEWIVNRKMWENVINSYVYSSTTGYPEKPLRLIKINFRRLNDTIRIDSDKSLGKPIIFGTGGEREGGAKESNTWFDLAINSQEPRTPQWWGFDAKGEIDWINIPESHRVSYPSRNEPSLRTKPWQDQVNEMAQYYNVPILKELDGEALEKRIAELKHGKQLVWDEVGILPQRFGMGIREQIEHADKTSLLWQTYPDRMMHHKVMNGLIQDNLLADKADGIYTIYNPSRRSGLTWSRKLMDLFMQAYKDSKSPFTNITRTKRPKKKKQHIVEPMSNIKL